MIKIKQGNIIKEKVDCIVNSTNAELAWEETTLNGDILNSGGIELIKYLYDYNIQHGDLKCTDTIITNGYNLFSKYIIHTYCPVWEGGYYNEIDKLRQCYINIFDLVKQYNIKSISIPAIATGVFRFPKHISASIGIKEAIKCDNNVEINFVLFDDDTYNIYNNIFNNV
jgi:O-acetyl-ADP-ribose deacetylase (regulator of RNase III)